MSTECIVLVGMITGMCALLCSMVYNVLTEVRLIILVKEYLLFVYCGAGAFQEAACFS